MTAQRNFKSQVRARMQQTGVNYTTARMELLKEYEERQQNARREAYQEHQTIVSRFFKDGAMTVMPSKRRTRAHILLYLVNYFQAGRTYTEQEVNRILYQLWPDFAYLRRELIDYGYLERNAHGEYWLTSFSPERWGTVLHDEAPAWEFYWLPEYLNGQEKQVDFFDTI
ncbi:DUF2087 domain-containing protein [Rothia sp. CCM 9418]|uniref:DUF2087 domain-containing protein n=1 Tax=Rothia sp. CCM 9418 TaxID=3402661 RepID=UPI003ADFAE2A